MRQLWIAMIAAGLAAFPVRAADALAPVQGVMKDVRIISYGAAPPDSGVLRTLRRIDVRNSAGAGAGESVWILWLGERQAMPPVDAVCDITYHEEDGGNLMISDGRVKVVDAFACDAAKP